MSLHDSLTRPHSTSDRSVYSETCSLKEVDDEGRREEVENGEVKKEKLDFKLIHGERKNCSSSHVQSNRSQLCLTQLPP